MAYDTELANRIRELVAAERGITEKAMFGGLSFLLHGNMSVSLSGQGGLLLRVDPAGKIALLTRPHAGECVMRGREMLGWLRVGNAGVQIERDLKQWVDLSISYAKTLPPK